jgi:hypothetical protein
MIVDGPRIMLPSRADLSVIPMAGIPTVHSIEGLRIVGLGNTRWVVRSLLALSVVLSLWACEESRAPGKPGVLAPDSGSSTSPIAPSSSPIRALTPIQFNHTIRDLLGMPMDVKAWPAPPPIAARLSPTPRERSGLFGIPAQPIAPWPWSFPAEIGVDHFEGMAEGQLPSAYSIEEIQLAATHFASFVLAAPIFFTCEGWVDLPDEKRAQCAVRSIERFAQRAWRRPMTDAEQERLSAFWMHNAASGTLEEALVLTVSGILQTPQFLYRSEVGNPHSAVQDAVPLNDWEMASRLSYFLWNSMPDRTLFTAAARGELSTGADVERHARRLLDNPRARDAVVHFHHQWLGSKDVLKVSPARRVYGGLYGIPSEPPLDTTGDGLWPSILGPVRHSMDAETHLFIERTLFDGAGTFHALLTDNHGYMSDHTAPLYGDGAIILSGPEVSWNYASVAFSMGSEGSINLYPVQLPADQRAGLLTLPSVLAVGAYPVHPAPILRGKRILERMACQELGVPLPDAEAAAPPDTAEAISTNRQRTADATSPAACDACHAAINPPGFAFENYDSLGRWRTEDNGLPIDASGTFSLFGGEHFQFTNAVELVGQLAESDQIRNCYVLRWARYATGVHLDSSDPTVVSLQAAFRENDQVKELLISIVTSDLFRYRRAGGEP